MGFTSGLRFLVPADTTDAETEVTTRVQAAMSGAAMIPVEPRPATTYVPPAQSAMNGGGVFGGGVVDRFRSRSPYRPVATQDGNSAPFWKRNIETFAQVNE